MRTWLEGPGGAPSHSVMIGTRSTDSTSLVTTLTLGIAADSRSAARSRSTSIARSRFARSASGRVIAPRPGPISITASSGPIAAASTSFLTHASSRKCCANRLRGRFFILLEIFGKWIAAPVAFLDLHDLFFAHAEVVAQLMDQRLADR